MENQPKLRFLSLFVPNLDAAAKRYQAIFGVEPSQKPECSPSKHPFSAKDPVVFDLGGVEIALYQCDGRVTQPGDVGIGIESDEDQAIAERAGANKGRVFFGPQKLSGEDREMSVFVLPDRHFFEVVSPQKDSES